jgi:PAS domain S-box-containing protein
MSLNNEKGEPLKHDAEALHEQREWLRVTLSSIGDAVITTDTKGLITYLNPVAVSLTGWTQEEAAGAPLELVFKIINEETRQPVENPATRALREGLVIGLANHTLLVSKHGTESAIDDSAAPIRKANGEIAGVVLVFRDVTDRRRAEHALRESEERFRLLVEGAQDYAIFTLDPEGNITSWNLGAERIKGYSADEIIGKHFSCFYPPEKIDAGHPDRELESAASEGRFEDEGWRLRKDGSKFWANVIIAALRDDRGRLKGFSKITRDRTEERRSESQLRDSEVRFRRLFETAKDGILILDASNGKITEANPFMTELLGYPIDELIGKELWQIGLFEDIEESQAAFQQLQKEGYIRYRDLPLETKSGRKAEVEFISNVYNVDHHSVIQCNIRDITDRRQLERAEAQAEALTDLHQRKDEFLAMLSHELRNPLAAITNAVQILDLQQDELPIQKKARTIIRRQTGNLVVLVNDLLEVSRILTGNIQLHREDIDLRGVIQQAIETSRPLIDQNKHELTLSVPMEPAWLHADAQRLEEVIINLLNNAAKYTPESGHIRLNLQQDDHELVLRVRDTGIGIAPDVLPHIFELFTQAPRSLDRSQGGLGVGLSVARKLVELHEGIIEAHSEGLGKGSEFIIRLPNPSTTPTLPQILAEQEKKDSGSGWRVLVVDDNVDSADSIAMLLQVFGHEVRVAYSGQAALEVAGQYEPHIVLLDIGLPEMDGYEVARRFRQHGQLEDVKLIAVTGYGRDSDRLQTREAGFDYHLVKPVDSQKLEDVLAMLMTK